MPHIEPSATMNDPLPAELRGDGWAEVFAEALAHERTRVREFLAAYSQRLQQQHQSLQAHHDELAQRLTAGAERAAKLQDRLAQTEKQLAETPPEPPVSQSASELKRRCEMALEEVRDLKARNQALEAQAREGRSASGSRPTSDGGLDWEAQKRRLLATLEAESHAEDAQSTARHLEIKEVVRKTEEAVRQKDREIADLRQLLDGQSKSIGSVAVGAAALEEIFNKDPLIEEQRNHLRRLQEQWEDKLRKAELELSVERAKLGRQRVEIEEKLRMLNSATASAAKPDEAEKAEPSIRGRWKSWLGLKDGPEQ